MNVSLTPELEGYVHEKVQSGRYTSASEVVREALRMLQERDESRLADLEAMRVHVQRGIDDAEAGRTRTGGPELFEAIKAAARARHGLARD